MTAPRDEQQEKGPPRGLWSDWSRRQLGFAAEMPTEPVNPYALPLGELLLYGCTSTVTDDPVLDVLAAVADEIELLAMLLRVYIAETEPEPAACRALKALARRTRAAAALHERVCRGLEQRLEELVPGR
jgi:hypothetical protein